MDGLMDGCMDGLMDGWMNGWFYLHSSDLSHCKYLYEEVGTLTG